MFQNVLSVHLLKIDKSVTNGGRVRREVRSSWWTLAESARSQYTLLPRYAEAPIENSKKTDNLRTLAFVEEISLNVPKFRY